jgi:hypothetical protein
MQTTTPPTLSAADVADPGRVRLGAGLRAARPRPAPAILADGGAALQVAPKPVPAVADAGLRRA